MARTTPDRFGCGRGDDRGNILDSAYVVTFDVPNATVGSLEIDGGIGTRNSTTLELQGNNALTILGGVTFVLNETSAIIDGSGTINLLGGLVSTTGLGTGPGTFMAGTDTAGGILDLAGTGSISSSSSIVFAISTAGPSTLRFDLAGSVVTTDEITINNTNQTLEIGRICRIRDQSQTGCHRR